MGYVNHEGLTPLWESGGFAEDTNWNHFLPPFSSTHTTVHCLKSVALFSLLVLFPISEMENMFGHLE